MILDLDVTHDACDPNPCPEPRKCINDDNWYRCDCPKGSCGYKCILLGIAIIFSVQIIVQYYSF